MAGMLMGVIVEVTLIGDLFLSLQYANTMQCL